MEAINTNLQEQTITFNFITGSENAKPSETLWTGRQVGKQPRKDIALSNAIRKVTAAEVQNLDHEKLAILFNDEVDAYIRRVKLQRAEIGTTITLTWNNETMLAMLTAPATRTKQLVSSASIRAMILSEEYKAALKMAIPEAKHENWKRIFEREFAPLICAIDASVSTTRATVRDTVVLRMIEISQHMLVDSQQRLIMEASAELLADMEVRDLEDSI